MPTDQPAANPASDSLEDKFTVWLNRPLASRADEILARMQAYQATPLEQQCALHADVLREAVRAAADRIRDEDKLTPEQAAVAVVVAFRAAQAQLSATAAPST